MRNRVPSKDEFTGYQVRWMTATEQWSNWCHCQKDIYDGGSDEGLQVRKIDRDGNVVEEES